MTGPGRWPAGTRHVIERIGELLRVARRTGVAVAFSRATHLPRGEDESPVHLHHLLRRGHRGSEPNVVIGTWGHQIVEQLTPQLGELVFDKFTFSSFHGTPLDKLLRTRGVKTIVLTGVASHGGVLTTARVATAMDYYVLVGPDCVGGLDPRQHAAALTILEPDTCSLSELGVWNLVWPPMNHGRAG